MGPFIIHTIDVPAVNVARLIARVEAELATIESLSSIYRRPPIRREDFGPPPELFLSHYDVSPRRARMFRSRRACSPTFYVSESTPHASGNGKRYIPIAIDLVSLPDVDVVADLPERRRRWLAWTLSSRRTRKPKRRRVRPWERA